MGKSTVGIQYKDYGSIKQLSNRQAGLNKTMNQQIGVLGQLNNKFKQTAHFQDNLRDRTVGLRREVSKIRNDLLLLSFALGVVKTSVVDAIKDSEKYKNSLLGLSSVARNSGQSLLNAKDAALELTKDGLLTLSDSAASLKNLLASKFDLPQAIQVMKTFKDAAAFNRQGTLQFGNAIVRATEGIKNQISALVDNVGITKNLSVIMKEAGFTMEDLTDSIKGAAARQALLNGLVKEGSFFMGDAAKVAETYSGASSRLSNKLFEVRAGFGAILTGSSLVPGIFQQISKSGFAMAEKLGNFLTVSKSVIQLNFEKISKQWDRIQSSMGAVAGVIGPPVISALKTLFEFFATSSMGSWFIQFLIFSKVIKTIIPYFQIIGDWFIKIFKNVSGASVFGQLNQEIQRFAQNVQIGNQDLFSGIETGLRKLEIQTIRSGEQFNSLTHNVSNVASKFSNIQKPIDAAEKKLKSLKKTANAYTNLLKIQANRELRAAHAAKQSIKAYQKENDNIGHLKNKTKEQIDTLNRLEKTMISANREYAKVMGSVKSATDNITASNDKALKSIGELESRLNDLNSLQVHLSDTPERLKQYQKEMNAAKKSTEDFNLVQRNLTNTSFNTVRGLQNTEEALKRLNAAGHITDKEMGALSGELSLLKDKAKLADKQVKKAGGSIDLAGKRTLNFGQKIKLLGIRAAFSAKQLGAMVTNIKLGTLAMKAFAAVGGAIIGILVSWAAIAILDWLSDVSKATDRLNAKVLELKDSYVEFQTTIKDMGQEFNIQKTAYDNFFKKIHDTVNELGNTNARFEAYGELVKTATSYSADFGISLRDMLAKADPSDLEALDKTLIQMKTRFADTFSFDDITKSRLEIQKLNKDMEGFDLVGLSSMASESEVVQNIMKKYKEIDGIVVTMGENINKKGEIERGVNGANIVNLAKEKKLKQDVATLTATSDRLSFAQKNIGFSQGKKLLIVSKDLVKAEKDLQEVQEKIKGGSTNAELIGREKILKIDKDQKALVLKQRQAFKDIAELITSVDEGEQKSLKTLIDKLRVQNKMETSLSKYKETLDKATESFGKGLFQKGTISKAAKHSWDMLSSLKGIDKQLAGLSKRNIQIDIFDENDIFTPSNFKNLEDFKKAFKTTFTKLGQDVTVVSESGSEILLKAGSDLKLYLDSISKVPEVAFRTTEKSLKGTGEQVRKKLQLFYDKLSTDEKAKFSFDLVLNPKSTSKVTLKIEAFRKTVQQRLAKAGSINSSVFGGLIKELDVLDVKLKQIVKDDTKGDLDKYLLNIANASGKATATLTPYEMKVKEVLENFKDIRKLEFGKAIDKINKSTTQNSKTLALQVASIQLVESAYTDLKGESVNYYKEVGEKAIEIARIEGESSNKVFALKEKISDINRVNAKSEAAIQALRERDSINGIKMTKQQLDNQDKLIKEMTNARNVEVAQSTVAIDNLNTEIAGVERLTEAQRGLIISKLKVSAITQVKDTHNAAILGSSDGILTDLLGFNPEKANARMEQLKRDMVADMQDLKQKLSAASQADNSRNQGVLDSLKDSIVGASGNTDAFNKMKSAFLKIEGLSDSFRKKISNAFATKTDPSGILNSVQKIIDKEAELNDADKTKLVEQLKTDQQKIALDQRLENYKQFAEQIGNLAAGLLSDTLFNYGKEQKVAKAQAQAQQEILKMDYRSRTISRRKFETESERLRRNTALGEKVALRERGIAEKEAMSERLKTLALEWGVRALAALAEKNFAGAALYAAAAATAGGHAISLGKQAAQDSASLERFKTVEQAKIDRFRGFGRGSQTSDPGSGSNVGGTVSAQELNITIAPSVTISGDTVLVGNMGVQELQASLGEATVNTINSAIENGEIDVDSITNGNVGA